MALSFYFQSGTIELNVLNKSIFIIKTTDYIVKMKEKHQKLLYIYICDSKETNIFILLVERISQSLNKVEHNLWFS